MRWAVFNLTSASKFLGLTYISMECFITNIREVAVPW